MESTARKERIELTDTGMDIAIKMSEGNPGALNVIMQMMSEGEKIDRASALGGFGAILSLDTLGIYGSRIWMLYKDVCSENLEMTLAVLRANQLGFLREKDLNHAIDNYGEGINTNELFHNVKERLGDDFGL